MRLYCVNKHRVDCFFERLLARWCVAWWNEGLILYQYKPLRRYKRRQEHKKELF
jgi:hypothetical protein